MLKPLGNTAIFTLAASVAFLFLAVPSDAQEAPLPPRDSARTDSVAPPEDSAKARAQTLKPVHIDARRESSGYSSGFTRSATKSPSLARDIPQSLTTVNGALIRDQGMRSMAEIVRYIPGMVTLPGFTRFDGALFAGIGWGLRAQVNVENILDDKYYATAHNNNNISPGSPRAARLTITARF